MKALVIYYSLSGHTHTIAEAIASELGADILRIQDVHDRSGALAALKLVLSVLLKRQSKIQPIEIDLAQFDLVIIGSPVWIMSLSTPVRTFLVNQKAKFKKVAFFCTEGSSGGSRVFKTMEDLIEKKPLATLEINESELKSNGYRGKLNLFIDKINLLTGSQEP